MSLPFSPTAHSIASASESKLSVCASDPVDLPSVVEWGHRLVFPERFVEPAPFLLGPQTPAAEIFRIVFERETADGLLDALQLTEPLRTHSELADRTEAWEKERKVHQKQEPSSSKPSTDFNESFEFDWVERDALAGDLLGFLNSAQAKKLDATPIRLEKSHKLTTLQRLRLCAIFAPFSQKYPKSSFNLYGWFADSEEIHEFFFTSLAKLLARERLHRIVSKSFEDAMFLLTEQGNGNQYPHLRAHIDAQDSEVTGNTLHNSSGDVFAMQPHPNEAWSPNIIQALRTALEHNFRISGGLFPYAVRFPLQTYVPLRQRVFGRSSESKPLPLAVQSSVMALLSQYGDGHVQVKVGCYILEVTRQVDNSIALSVSSDWDAFSPLHCIAETKAPRTPMFFGPLRSPDRVKALFSESSGQACKVDVPLRLQVLPDSCIGIALKCITDNWENFAAAIEAGARAQWDFSDVKVRTYFGALSGIIDTVFDEDYLPRSGPLLDHWTLCDATTNWVADAGNYNLFAHNCQSFAEEVACYLGAFTTLARGRFAEEVESVVKQTWQLGTSASTQDTTVHPLSSRMWTTDPQFDKSYQVRSDCQRKSEKVMLSYTAAFVDFYTYLCRKWDKEAYLSSWMNLSTAARNFMEHYISAAAHDCRTDDKPFCVYQPVVDLRPPNWEIFYASVEKLVDRWNETVARSRQQAWRRDSEDNS